MVGLVHVLQVVVGNEFRHNRFPQPHLRTQQTPAVEFSNRAFNCLFLVRKNVRVGELCVQLAPGNRGSEARGSDEVLFEVRHESRRGHHVVFRRVFESFRAYPLELV